MQYYLDRLPNPQRVTKVNTAIVPATPPHHVDFYSVDPSRTDELPAALGWLRGCALARPPTASDPLMIGLTKANRTDLLVQLRVPATTVAQLFQQHGVESIGYLKIDVNGLEGTILPAVGAACEAQPGLWPRRIAYEQGALPGRGDVRSNLLKGFTRNGYRPALKPAHVRKPGHSPHYQLNTWDMVLDRAPA